MAATATTMKQTALTRIQVIFFLHLLFTTRMRAVHASLSYFVCLFFSQYSVLFVVNVLIQILCIAFFIHQCFHKSNRILEGAFDDTKQSAYIMFCMGDAVLLEEHRSAYYLFIK